jgi:hypothetical protein
VHVVVAWYQAGRGNRVGCERQLEKAARRLGPFAPSHRGVDVATLPTDVARAQERGSGGSLDLVEPEGFQQLLDGDAEPPVAVEEEEQP